MPETARTLSYAQAIREAQDCCLARDPNVLLMGLGVPDPKGVFGTTTGLGKAYGSSRVMDIPLSENAVTGIAIGAAITGMRPVLTHQRVDFALVAMEQMVNQAAKWHYMFGGRMKVPLVIRMVIGRGWGQGPQHSQSLQSWFAHIPGLKVVLPATPRDAKGLLIAAIEDDNPVIYLEHRWLHNIKDVVPEGHYSTNLGEARIVRPGRDVTIVATSYMVLEALRAAEILHQEGIDAEIVDPRTLRPLDEASILQSVARTGRLVVADTGWRPFGAAGEIIALVTEQAFDRLKAAPARVCLPDVPTPTAPALAAHFYPRAGHIAAAVLRQFGRTPDPILTAVPEGVHLDAPDPTFTGPF